MGKFTSDELLDSSLLELGKGSKKKLPTCCCPDCNIPISVGINTVSVICPKCNKFFNVSALKKWNQENIDDQFQAPHIANTELLKFRGRMENEAMIFREQQIANNKSGGKRKFGFTDKGNVK